MRTIFFLLAGLFTAGELFAQGTPLLTRDHLVRVGNLAPAGSSVESFDIRESKVKGSPYLYDDWVSGKIVFDNGDEMENLQLNFDLHSNLLEIKMDQVVKVALPKQVRSVSIFHQPEESSRFIPVAEFRTEEGEAAEGFAQVLYDGKIKLVKKNLIEIHKPTYRPSHDVGSLDYTIRKKEKLYLLEEGILKEVKRKSDFGKWSKKMKAYARENNLRFRNEEDLVQLVRHYDSLLDYGQ